MKSLSQRSPLVICISICEVAGEIFVIFNSHRSGPCPDVKRRILRDRKKKINPTDFAWRSLIICMSNAFKVIGRGHPDHREFTIIVSLSHPIFMLSRNYKCTKASRKQNGPGRKTRLSDVDAAFFVYFLALASIIPCVHTRWKARGQSYLAEK